MVSPALKHDDRTPKPMRGFTLIEMLLAIVIIGVIGTTVATATAGVANQMYALERRTIANWIASNQMTRLRLSQDQRLGQPIAKGRKTARFFMGNRQWLVEQRITETETPWLHRIEIDVFELQDGEKVGPLHHMTAFLGRY
jgi:general secretion pathway protein I